MNVSDIRNPHFRRRSNGKANSSHKERVSLENPKFSSKVNFLCGQIYFILN